ncbi:GrpB family protein [Micromonospora sp. NPDC049903]|uniref:GrpB family protein n=1 Tax=Micromonospora sp. NPDC049903 TaxID=3364276 RepID=UPI0037A3E92A
MTADRDADDVSGRRDRITIVAYDPRWPASFDHQRNRIEAALGNGLVGRVEHVGSTAVPGLAAKPIIDMLALVSDYDQTAGLVTALGDIGWVHAPEPGDHERRKWSFCYPDVVWRTHHLHIWEVGSPDWRRLLPFRDYLRRHPDLAAEYARLKAELAAVDDSDRPRYRSGKAPFIQDILRRAVPGRAGAGS